MLTTETIVRRRAKRLPDCKATAERCMYTARRLTVVWARSAVVQPLLGRASCAGPWSSSELRLGLLPSHGLEGEFADLAQMSTLTPVQHALTALQEVQKPQPYNAYLQQVWPF
jgi:hypothetical protein